MLYVEGWLRGLPYRPEARSVRRFEAAATAAESLPNDAIMPLVKSPILTPAKLAANRSNACRSTGPRSTAGKRRVRLNGLKHGPRSRSFAETVIRSAREKERFGRGVVLLRLAFVPAGSGAASLVERVSRLMWTRGRTAGPRGRQPYFSLTNMERALLAPVAQVCAWWYADEAIYRALPANPRCPLESTDSSGDSALLRFPIWAAARRPKRRAEPNEPKRLKTHAINKIARETEKRTQARYQPWYQ